jgi:nucleotide-binding universal stress UspA family protein
MMFGRILVALDFGAASHAALTFASRLLESGGRLRLVCSLEPALPLMFDGVYVAEDPGPAIRERLEQTARDVGSLHGIKVDTAFVTGSPWRSILAEAKRFGADAIFMGSHGRSGARRLFLGSVAERVVRESPIPVCVVKEGAPSGSGKLRKIGLATELSRAPSRATAVGKRLAAAHHATLELLHVISNEDLRIPPALVFEFGSAAADELTVRRLDRLQRFGDRVGRSAGISVLESISLGNVPARLASEAKTKGLDLLVMGTHGRKGLERLVFGSVAAETIRKASCPVLVVNDTKPASRPARGGGSSKRTSSSRATGNGRRGLDR